MSRVQLALNVTDIDSAVEFYGKLFESPAQVSAATSRLAAVGLPTAEQDSVTCCYAVQDTVWLSNPDGAPWEVYTVLVDAPVDSGLAGDGTCCASGDTGAACC